MEEEQPQLATDVRDNIQLPTNTRSEWSRKRDFGCSCGFSGPHPLCHSCGLGIGPQHYQKKGKVIPVPVYVDWFNEEEGYWEVKKTEENRLVCLSCLVRLANNEAHFQPIRQTTRIRRRHSVINTWRKKRGLPALPPP